MIPILTQLVCLTCNGNGPSGNPYISGDGRFVAFASLASNLVSGDLNGQYDAFVAHVDSGAIDCLTLGGNAMSDTRGISRDGRFVAIESSASNLVPGDTNEHADAFIYDRRAGAIVRLSDGADDCFLSEDGRFFGWTSYPNAFMQEGFFGPLEIVATPADGDWIGRVGLSFDGRYVAYMLGHLEFGFATFRVYLKDREFGTVEEVDDGSGFHWSLPAISADGRFLASQCADGLCLYDRTLGTVDSLWTSISGLPVMTPDARFIAFDDGGARLLDRQTGHMCRGGASLSDDASRIAIAGSNSNVYVRIR